MFGGARSVRPPDGRELAAFPQASLQLQPSASLILHTSASARSSKAADNGASLRNLEANYYTSDQN